MATFCETCGDSMRLSDAPCPRCVGFGRICDHGLNPAHDNYGPCWTISNARREVMALAGEYEAAGPLRDPLGLSFPVYLGVTDKLLVTLARAAMNPTNTDAIHAANVALTEAAAEARATIEKHRRTVLDRCPHAQVEVSREGQDGVCALCRRTLARRDGRWVETGGAP